MMSSSSLRIPRNSHAEQIGDNQPKVIANPVPIARSKVVGKTQAQLIELLHQTYNNYN